MRLIVPKNSFLPERLKSKADMDLIEKHRNETVNEDIVEE